MLFNSYEFIYLFLPIVFSIYWAVVKYNQSFGIIILSVASVVFYSIMALNYLPLMLFSIITNYFCGCKIIESKKRKILILGIVFNLSLIFIFKYIDFFVSTISHSQRFLWNEIIPLGISFYTFTQISFLVDAYNGKISKDVTFKSYFLFVTYFPHLIAGPILHHKEMIDQFAQKIKYQINYENIAVGLTFFSIGLFKKVIIADSLIPYVRPVFEAASFAEKVTPLECWCGALSYTFQLYFDFSGYSDMAIGISKLFNFNLPFNFNSPYKSTSIIDFWKRWHISLSNFLRDYLYIPLGGNRKGVMRRYINIFITMFLGGVWHGANLTFVFWGAYHGVLICLNHLWRSFFKSPSQYFQIRFLNTIFTFLLVVVGWVIFRSKDMQTSLYFLKRMFYFPDYLNIPSGWSGSFHKLGIIPMDYGLQFVEMPYFSGKYHLILLCTLGCICFFFKNTQELIVPNVQAKKTRFYNWQPNHRWAVVIIIISFYSIFKIGSASEFLYFQF